MEKYEVLPEENDEEETDMPEEVTLDLTGCTTGYDFWERIKKAFLFYDYFGKNWDAFWDLLRTHPAHKVTIIGANLLPKNWKIYTGDTYAETMERILLRNKEFQEHIHYEFEYEFIDV